MCGQQSQRLRGRRDELRRDRHPLVRQDPVQVQLARSARSEQRFRGQPYVEAEVTEPGGADSEPGGAARADDAARRQVDEEERQLAPRAVLAGASEYERVGGGAEIGDEALLRLEAPAGSGADG